MYKLELLHHFDAAHQLKEYIGACANLHGHSWKLKITIETEELVKDMVIDFKDIKKAIDEKYDHKLINEMVNFNPIAENISKDIFGLVKNIYDSRGQGNLEEKPAVVLTVTVWESENASITYTE
jgi:6-pyruvoyltetrahydropterin/6-carboxytetrahydropterin synthase